MTSLFRQPSPLPQRLKNLHHTSGAATAALFQSAAHPLALIGAATLLGPPPRWGVGMQSSFDDGSVAIRRFRPDDVATVLEAARESIEELCHWMVWCHPDYNITD